jgi:uncharacterized membrane protein
MAASTSYAFAMISPRLSVAVVGVAIATALVPPLSASAICLARGNFVLAFDAFALAFTNIVAIQVAGSFVMWTGGFRGSAQAARIRELLKRNLLSAIIVGALAIVLAVQLRKVVGAQLYEASVRAALNVAATNHNGAYLTDLRVQKIGNRALVTAVYRTPTPFTPDEVGTIEPSIPAMPGTSSLELRIRSVPVTVASRAGYIFSSDPADHDRP